MAHTKIKCKLTFLFSLYSILVLGQNQVFEKYYSNFQSHCHFIVKDTLWIGSSKCLMKFLISENKVLQIYSRENSPINNTITDIWVDKSNRVCVILNSQRIALLDGGQWQVWDEKEFTSVPATGNFSLSDLIISDSGTIYCQEWYKKAIYAFKDGQWTAIIDLAAMNGHLRKFLYHSSGNVWWFYDSGGESFLSPVDSIKQMSIDREILDIDFAPDETLYGIEHYGRIVNIKPNGTIVIKAIIPNFFFDYPSLKVDKNGAVYIIQSRDLFILKDKKINKFTNDKLQYGPGYAVVYLDELDKPWIQYPYDNIICKLENDSFSVLKVGIFSEQYDKANADKSMIWFSTNDYVCNYNVITGQVTHFDLPPGKRPNGFAEDTDPDQMWLGTSDDLIHYNGNSFEIIDDPLLPQYTNVYGLKRLSHSELIASFYNGGKYYFQKFDINNKTWTDLTSPRILFKTVATSIDKTNKIWANQIDSLAYFDQGSWKYLSPSNSGMPKEKWSLIEFDSNNKLYAISTNKLYRYDGQIWELLDSNYCGKPIDLLIDSKDWIWVLNGCLGLKYYNGSKWTHLTPSNSNISFVNYPKLEEDANGDIWISSNPALKLSLHRTASKEQKKNDRTLIIYPNPANQFVTINCPDNNGSLSIYNLFGAEVFKSNVSENTTTLSVEDFTPGLYTIVWRSSMHKLISKVLFIN